MKKFTLNIKMCLSLMICLVFMAFSTAVNLDEQPVFIKKMLMEHYDESAGPAQIKRYEINVTNTGFCRYKRFFAKGKVEYFSFNLLKFKDLDYYGNDKKGTLLIRTLGDDVIVQTYNDKEGGDIDSMASYMSIPLKNIEANDLIAISERMVKMNALLLAQK